MLDSEFNAKLGDFGLARTLEQSENTHHTTKVIAGTPVIWLQKHFLLVGKLLKQMSTHLVFLSWKLSVEGSLEIRMSKVTTTTKTNCVLAMGSSQAGKDT